jgi:hypothetical protein
MSVKQEDGAKILTHLLRKPEKQKYLYHTITGSCRSVVFEALCYKPEGRGFEFRLAE